MEDNWNVSRTGGGSLDALIGSLDSSFDFQHVHSAPLILDPEMEDTCTVSEKGAMNFVDKSCARFIALSFSLGVLMAVLFCSIAAQAGILDVQIVDEEGRPTPARVYLRTAKGLALHPAHTITYDHCTKWGCEYHFIPPDGVFRMTLPAGSYRLGIERGKEYLPIEQNLTISQQARVSKKIFLGRWVHMVTEEWYSADMHSHAKLRDLPTLIEGEDLNVAFPITLWRLPGGSRIVDVDLRKCLERGDAHGVVTVEENRWFACINEELESDQSALLVSRLGRKPVALRYPFLQFTQEAHRRHALVDSEKPTALELPATAALGGVDLVGLANNHLWRSGCDLVHWGAWPKLLVRPSPKTCAGFASAGFDIYYALLQMGFPLKLSAGSAYGVHPVPMGWSRIYVHVLGNFTPDRWWDALQQGHSFVTTGPMLLLKANHLEPGDQFRGQEFPLRVQVEVELLSRTEADHVEIVINGSPQLVRMKPDPSRTYAYRGQSKVALQSSSWLAARFIQPQGSSVVVAHTSPIYFWRGNDSISPSTGAAQYLRSRMEELLAQARAGQTGRKRYDLGAIPDASGQRHQMLHNFEDALKVYTHGAP